MTRATTDETVIGEETANPGPWPLWAVDHVVGRELWAVDLNTAPGIRGSGVEKILSGKECHEEIEKWVMQNAPVALMLAGTTWHQTSLT